MNRPIGIFDSGVGGLTVANAVAQLLPNEQIIYFGDSAHLPFGDKSHHAIQTYSLAIADFLQQKDCKAIVIACNTASAVAYATLQEKVPSDILVVDVINPIVNAVVKNDIKKVGIIGTKVTIDSAVYTRKLLEQNNELNICSKATRSLVPIIEEGLHHKKHLLFSLLDNYLGDPPMNTVEGLILGCTHYPLIKDEIKHYFNDQIFVYDAPTITAQYLKEQLHKNDLLNTKERQADHRFFVSDFTPAFESIAQLFFGSKIKLEEHIW